MKIVTDKCVLLKLGVPLLLLMAGPVSAEVAFPARFGAGPEMVLGGQVQVWQPDSMYEHVNGEAELLIRYGALSLHYAFYEGTDGATLGVDLVDLGAAVNAYGLLALYTGCDGTPEEVSGAVVYAGPYTSYARRGRFFLRIDSDGSDGPALAGDFLRALAGVFPAPEPLPAHVTVLQGLARKACEVGYHPEDVDYDLQAGPGYFWTAPGGQGCFLRLFPSEGDASAFRAALSEKGLKSIRNMGKAVAWSKDEGEEMGTRLQKTLEKVRDVDR